ncbi:TBC1 domain family member 14 [Astyanax mexicanus]|uniref:TBC1 domain family member 14 n=1 Tax=Astyanax mexicanus TaxID=7994 RepID=A0A8T2LZ19_ASTMX|nr:TBC1 domain family member 14 [Astyanax mexicanus]
MAQITAETEQNPARRNPQPKPGSHAAENGSSFGPHTPDHANGLPSYSPALLSSAPCMEDDQHSLASQDSGIPTLEINPSEHVHAFGPNDEGPATLTLESSDAPLHKSSTFPRSGSEWRHFSPAGGALNRSDDISVCSVSSLSTELSTTLSLSNDDIIDFVVTSDSSAVVTFEDGGGGGGGAGRFSDASLTPSAEQQLQHHHHQGASTPEEFIPRRSPIMNFLNRNLFSKKLKDGRVMEGQRELGWKLFGRVPNRALKENERGAGAGDSPSLRQSVRKNLDFEPLSTTALILEQRPPNLPAKPAEEAEKHQQQYEEMVAQAKKRELKEAQKRKKQLEDRVKQEESIGNAALCWSQEILPNWTTTRSSKRVRELWWQGVPPSVRGRVWSLAIGNDLNITHELYNICLSRAKERWNASPAPVTSMEMDTGDSGSSHADREASLELIKLDISRTFPSLCIFQKGGPYHDVLHSILGAYTCYRPDVGYVQGMSFIAAVLILNMHTADAFVAFANLLNKPCQMAFYRVDHSLMLTYFAAFEVFFEENLPKLFAHFKSNNLTPDIYLIDWIFTLYSKSLPLDVACRVWDVFCRDGEEFLFRTALGILRLYEDVLTHMDFIHNAQFLTRLPEHINTHTLFSSISAVSMSCRNGRWSQVLQALQKDPERASPVLKR